MRPILAPLAALALIIAQPTATLAQNKGDWVLANYQEAGYWFPGVVSARDGDHITVQYDDGDVETLHRRLVKPYTWKVGTSVECNFKGAGDWYAGKIAKLDDPKVTIKYDDGDVETTTTGACRSKV